jgi:hypothetical protein
MPAVGRIICTQSSQAAGVAELPCLSHVSHVCLARSDDRVQATRRSRARSGWPLRCSGDGRQTNDGSADAGIAGIAGPPSSQFSASVNANLISRHQQCPGPWPCCCCCCCSCCCSSLSLHILSTVHFCQVTNAPMPPQIPYPALPCPALPTFFLVASILSSLVPSAYPALPSPSVQCSAVQCSRSAHLAPRVPSHLLLCSPTASLRAPCPSAICLPCLSVRRCLSAGPVMVALLI